MKQTPRMRPPRVRHPRRIEQVAAAFRADYRAYQYRFVEFFIEHLSDVSRAFRGDVQAVLVLALIGQAWLNAARAAVEAGTAPEDMPTARTSTSASRIADVTGIPRQTVRRKLAALEARGWIVRNDDGTVRLVSAGGETVAKRDLADIDRRALQRVARLFAELEALVEAVGGEISAGDCRGRPSEARAQNEHLGPSVE